MWRTGLGSHWPSWAAATRVPSHATRALVQAVQGLSVPSVAGGVCRRRESGVGAGVGAPLMDHWWFY
jgi:hypothetical protein